MFILYTWLLLFFEWKIWFKLFFFLSKQQLIHLRNRHIIHVYKIVIIRGDDRFPVEYKVSSQKQMHASLGLSLTDWIRWNLISVCVQLKKDQVRSNMLDRERKSNHAAIPSMCLFIPSKVQKYLVFRLT